MTKETSRTFERLLPVLLDNDEKLHRANELAACYEDKRRIKAAAAEERKRVTARLAEVDARAAELAAQLRSGTEERPVPCEEVLDFKRGCAEVMRTDTGEVVDSRPLRQDDRQAELIPIDGGAEPPARPAKPSGGV